MELFRSVRHICKSQKVYEIISYICIDHGWTRPARVSQTRTAVGKSRVEVVRAVQSNIGIIRKQIARVGVDVDVWQLVRESYGSWETGYETVCQTLSCPIPQPVKQAAGRLLKPSRDTVTRPIHGVVSEETTACVRRCIPETIVSITHFF